VLPSRAPNARALLRSQAGPRAGRALTALPTGHETTLPPLRMNVILRRRLRLPLPLAARRCNGVSCRTPLDELGDHWAACPRSGRLRRRANPVERTWARVLTEGGAQVLHNQKLADMGLPGVRTGDKRAVEIVARNLHVKHGIPLAFDATVVSPLHASGGARPRAADEDGVAIAAAERDKRETYPELVRSPKCQLVVLACEVGGRWSSTCAWLVRELAEARSAQAPPRLRRSTARAWEARWWGMLAVAVQNALAATLVDDAPHLLHGWEGEGPPLGVLLHGEAPTESRLPLR